MRTLVLGGTVFLSRAVAEEFLARGHDVTCLSRGESGEVVDGARWVRADRTQGPSAYTDLSGSWDCVVDVSWVPDHVADALVALGSSCGHWTYVSSCSVYADQGGGALDESSPAVEPLERGVSATIEAYAAAKVACERLCASALEGRLHLSRPGLIGGPGDPSDRFGYWPARLARDLDGDVLVPDALTSWTQTIDVRDLAAWLVTASLDGVTGTYNVVGEQVTLGDVLAHCRTATGHQGRFVPVDETWLADNDVQPWAGPDSLPLWIPRSMNWDAFARRQCEGALARGLRRRPVFDTVVAALGDETERGLHRERRAGLDARRERELLDRWGARDGLAS